MKPIRLFLVDDHIIVRKGILMFLNTEPSVVIVGEAEDGQSAVARACSLQPVAKKWPRYYRASPWIITKKERPRRGPLFSQYPR